MNPPDYFAAFGIVFIAGFLLLSVYFLSGRGGFLISGYNTLPKAEKEKYNEEALCKSMGKFSLILSVFLIFLFYGIYVQKTWMTAAATICVLVFTIGWVIYMNKTSKFKK